MVKKESKLITQNSFKNDVEVKKVLVSSSQRYTETKNEPVPAWRFMVKKESKLITENSFKNDCEVKKVISFLFSEIYRD